MEHQVISLSQLAAIIRRRFWLVYFVGGLVTLLLLLYISTIPFVYRSYSMVALEPAESSATIVGEGSGEVLEKKVQLVKNKILSREHLSKVVSELNLRQPDQTLEEAIVSLRDSINIESISAGYIDPKYGLSREATVALELSKEDTDPQMAYDVALRLLTDFLTESQSRTSQIIENKSKVLGSEVEKQAEAIDALERKIAAFKAKHSDKLPEFRDFNLDLLRQQQQQLLSIDQELTQARQQRARYSAELSSTSPYSSIKNQTTGEEIFSNDQKVRSLQVRLAEAKRKYTPDHPDVRRLGRELELAQQSIDDVQSYTSSVPTRADNPAYISLRSQVSAMDSRISSLTQIRAEVASKIAQYEKSFDGSPEIEREYNGMIREFENRKANYLEIRNQLSDAQIAESVNRLGSGDKLSVIERAAFPDKPERPNKLVLSLLALAVAGALGVIAMIMREMLDGSIKDSYELTDMTGTQPLAVIRDMGGKGSRVMIYCAGFVLLSAVILVGLYANNKLGNEITDVINATLEQQPKVKS